MHKLYYFAAIVFFFSCNNQESKKEKDTIAGREPSKTVIDSLVKDWYAQKVKPGSPSWEVNNVSILDMSKESGDDDLYHLTVVASGTENPPAIPQPPPPSNFSDTVKLDLVRKSGNWAVAKY